MIRTRLSPLLAALVLPAIAGGQVPFDVCRDRNDQPIPGVEDNTMVYAGMATMRNGHPVILWNRRTNERVSRTEQIFVYLHECAHHTLGHLYRNSVDAQDELEADCWAIQLMVDGGMIQGRHLSTLEKSRRGVRGDASHLGGEAHVRSLERCLSIRTDPAAWATALDTLAVAAQDSFAARRGRILDSTGTAPVYDALLDVPGTYDCEVLGAAFRCTVFAARKSGAAADRYRRLSKIFRSWLPPSWTYTERAGDDGASRTWLAQDALTGTLLTLAQSGTRVYLLVKRDPV